MQSQTLKKADDETNPVGAGEFKIGWWWELSVDLNDFLEENGDGANAVPEQDRQVIESLSFSAE